MPLAMRHVTSLLLATSLLVAVGSSASAGVAKGDRASELGDAKDAKGKRFRLKEHRGSVVVLTFGASWCKPCKKELPAYEKLAKRYKEQGAKVRFVAVNIDSERRKADRFVAETNVKIMSVVFDPAGKAVDRYEPETMPTTYVLDGKGIVRDVHNGYVKGDEKKIMRVVDSLLKKL